MTRLVWGTPGARYFETGVDRGVLYPETGPGVPWNGLTSVSETPQGGEPRPFYIDGFKYINLAAAEEFAATIEAFSSPDEFGVSDGTAFVSNGLFVTQQPRRPFGFCYRTRVGNDIDGTDHGYKLHLVYNALAAPAERTNETRSDSLEASVFSWAITTKPPRLTGRRPTAHLVVDSRKTPRTLLAHLEDILYGSDLTLPELPPQQEIIDLFNSPGPVLRRNVAINSEPTYSAAGTSVEVHRNLALQPVPTVGSDFSYQAAPGEVSAHVLITGASDGPEVAPGVKVTSYMRRTITTVSTATSGIGFYQYQRAPIAADAGQKGIVSGWIRSSAAIQTRMNSSWRNASNQAVGDASGVYVNIPANTWVRLIGGEAIASASASHLGWWAVVQNNPTWPSNTTIDVTAVQPELGSTPTPYHDGNITYDPLLTPSWTGYNGQSASILTGKMPVGWTVSPNELAYMVTDEGKTAVELADPNGSGGGYVLLQYIDDVPQIGEWIAVGVDLKPLRNESGRTDYRPRIISRLRTGTTIVEQVTVGSGNLEGLPVNTWSRRSSTLQRTAAGIDNVQILFWPADASIAPIGPQVRMRRVVIAYAKTEAESLAAVESHFTGDTPTDGVRTYTYEGAQYTTPSVERGWI